MNKRIAIVGGGYAGIAAAVTLSAAGHRVSVFERSKVLGGRARKVEIVDRLAAGQPQGERAPLGGAATEGSVGGNLSVDNGQHILIGAYRDTLRLLQTIGIAENEVLLRTPLALHYPNFRLVTPRLPAPLHLLWGLLDMLGADLGKKLSAIRFMQALKRSQFRLPTDCTVQALLDQHQQPEVLRRYLWEPLCISALNTPSSRASAQVFVNVLRDSLAGPRAASDLLFPRVDLSALLPEKAAAWLAAHGSEIHTATAVTAVAEENGRFRLAGTDAEHFDAVILAVAPYHLTDLLPQHAALDDLRHQIAALQWEPITTLYLRYPAHARLPHPMLGLEGNQAHWVFDRGQIAAQPGLFAAVISASATSDAAALAAAVDTELRASVPDLPAPLWHRAISEKRATFACTPNLQRPGNASGMPGLYLAGDYTASDYPATLESAVQSGIAAAQAVLA